MTNLDAFKRYDGEWTSKISCACGQSFEWSSVDDRLRPWVELHGPHLSGQTNAEDDRRLAELRDDDASPYVGRYSERILGRRHLQGDEVGGATVVRCVPASDVGSNGAFFRAWLTPSTTFAKQFFNAWRTQEKP